MNTQLGDLRASDIGQTLSIKDGGSIHRGTLRSVQHEGSTLGANRTMVVMRDGDWRLIKSYPSDTACALTEPASA